MNNLGRGAWSKVAGRLIPFLVLCYFIAFLDRVNAGFAAQTICKELGFTAEMFGLGSASFSSATSYSRSPRTSSWPVSARSQPVADGDARGVWLCRSELSKVQREHCAPQEGSPW